MAAPTPTDVWIETPNGEIFARSWSPASAAPADRAPILLFHDSLGCVDLWREFPQRLSDATRRNVVAYDRLGFGRSAPHPNQLAFDFIADEARRFVPLICERFGVSDFVACGHSVGGCIAVETAVHFPQRCRALISMSAIVLVEEQTRDGVSRARQEFAAPESLERLKKYHGDKARWVVDAWTETWLAPEYRDWSQDASLRRIACPTLAIHGADDEYGSVEHPKRVAGDHGALEILDGVGHFPFREAPELALQLIQRFLNPAP